MMDEKTEGTQLKKLLNLDEAKKSEMEFDILTLHKNETVTFEENKEIVYILVKGRMSIAWNGEHRDVKRDSCFYENPIALDAPPNLKVELVGNSDLTEVAILKANNEETFSPVFYGPEDCPSENRGAGAMGETATRVVRNIIDFKEAPYSKFFLGEVINYPGKWSSYPPHVHEQPEIYYYKFLPENGFGYSANGKKAVMVEDGNFQLFTDSNMHCQVAAPGYAMYYIWVIKHLNGNRHTGPNMVEDYAWVGAPNAIFFPDLKDNYN